MLFFAKARQFTDQRDIAERTDYTNLERKSPSHVKEAILQAVCTIWWKDPGLYEWLAGVHTNGSITQRRRRTNREARKCTVSKALAENLVLG